MFTALCDAFTRWRDCGVRDGVVLLGLHSDGEQCFDGDGHPVGVKFLEHVVSQLYRVYFPRCHCRVRFLWHRCVPFSGNELEVARALSAVAPFSELPVRPFNFESPLEDMIQQSRQEWMAHSSWVCWVFNFSLVSGWWLQFRSRLFSPPLSVQISPSFPSFSSVFGFGASPLQFYDLCPYGRKLYRFRTNERGLISAGLCMFFSHVLNLERDCDWWDRDEGASSFDVIAGEHFMSSFW
ncbi:VP9b [Lishui pangolin virus]|nr:VP9b [Lishui pangolin virus]